MRKFGKRSEMRVSDKTSVDNKEYNTENAETQDKKMVTVKWQAWEAIRKNIFHQEG